MPASLVAVWLKRGLNAVTLVTSLSAAAADSTRKQHAAILARALSYELTLDDRAGSSVGVAVVYKRGNAASEANAEAWFQALRELSSLKIKDKPFFTNKVPLGLNELTAAVDKDGIDVLLVSEGVASESELVTRFARAKHLLSVSNDVALVESNVTLCIAEQEGKLKVIVNLKAAEAENIRFSSNLLKVAKLIR